MTGDRRFEDHLSYQPPDPPQGQPIPVQTTPDTEHYVDPGHEGPLQQVFPHDAPQPLPAGPVDTARLHEPAMQPATDHPSPDHNVEAVGYQTTYQLKQGLYGEIKAAESLAADGHTIVFCKRDIADINQGGFDIVTIKDSKVFLIDNKAITTGRNISSASALTTNFDKNLARLVNDLKERQAAETNPATQSGNPNLREPYEVYTEALQLIEVGQYQKAVTGHALAAEGQQTTGVTANLAAQGVQFIPNPSQGLPPLEPVFAESSSSPTPPANVSPAASITPVAPLLGPGGGIGGR
jgi:hypothetical protein